MTRLAEYVKQSAARLANAGIDTAALDARVLMAHVLSLPTDALIGQSQRELRADEIATMERLIARREQREPVSQLVGMRGFWKADFIVNAHVLIPRPDSETMMEALLKHRAEKNAPYRLLDLGTGSGCLLLSALQEYAQATGVGIDKSAEALKVARANAQRLELSARASFIESDWLENAPEDLRADIVLMNPPYIPTRDVEMLDRDVKDYEPRLALDGGQDGIACYRNIFSQLTSQFRLYLSHHALILVEVGVNQAHEVAQLGRTNGMKLLEIIPDLAGIDRVVVLELP